MSHTVLRESSAIILYGHKAERDANVSEDVRALGLSLIKAAPAECQMIVVPDFIQSRFSVFKDFMSAFCYSSVHSITISNMLGGYMLRFDDFNPEDGPLHERAPLIPVTTAPITLAWSVETSDEVWAQMDRDISGYKYEGTSGGKRAMFYRPENWFGYKGYQGRGLNPIADAPIGTVNPTSLASMKVVICAITAMVHAIRYPAFQDHEHASTFFTEVDPFADVRVQKTRRVQQAMEGEDATGSELAVETYYETVDVAPPIAIPDADASVKTDGLQYQLVSYQNLPEGKTFIDITSNVNDLPPGGGFWVPYFRVLAKYDLVTVPNLLRQYVPLLYGTTRGSTMASLDTVCSEWGINGNTDAGKELSHIAKCLQIAMQAQARVIPCIRRGQYAGCVILGVGYVIRFQNEFIRPATQEMLRSAIVDSDAHLAALRDIASKFAEADRPAVLAVQSMKVLHELVLQKRLKQSDESSIIRSARSLSFKGHKYWSPNLSNIENALRIIRNAVRTEEVTHDFPLHPNYLFSTNMLELTWSCFGNQAPSFRHPQGTKFFLKDNMTFAQKTASGMQKRNLVRIFIRTKPIATAIEDLAWVRENKAIENPTQAPKAKESQSYMDKNFSGAMGTALMSALRNFADVELGTSKGKGKRGADDDDVVPDAKRKRGESSLAVDI